MSILNYIRRKDSASKGVFLPDPTVESANTCVGDLAFEPASKHRKVTPHTYGAKTKAHVGKYASYNGPQAGVWHFTKLHGHNVPESTARNYFRDAYFAQLNSVWTRKGVW